jgi:hypothetical protein
VLRQASGGSRKRQRVYKLSLRGLQAKQIVVGDAAEAHRVEDILWRLSSTGIVPGLIACYGDELWVEYIEGAPLHASEPPPTRALGALFRTLYTESVEVGPATDLLAPVCRDLAVLRAAGLLSSETRDALEARAEGWLPQRVWRGFDYVDARPANLLTTSEGLRIIDVESLVAGEVLGTGAARAWLRWPGLERDALLAAIAAPDVPDFAAYADFLELRYLARWGVRCALQRKPHLIKPHHFDALSARPV